MLAASILPKEVQLTFPSPPKPTPRCTDKQRQGFSITQGESNMKKYIDTKTDSGKPLTRTFCSDCGSKLLALTPLNDNIVSVAAGSLDDFDSWKPDKEQWCIHRSDFVEKMKGIEGKDRHIMSVQSKPEEEWDAGVGMNEGGGGVGSVH